MAPEQNPALRPLRKRRDFVAMRKGYYRHSPSFILQMRQRDEEQKVIKGPRIGYTVTKKTGNAVIRSRIKRRLRALIHTAMAAKKLQDCDYVLIGKRAALNTDFRTMVAELDSSLERLHQKSLGSGTRNGK